MAKTKDGALVLGKRERESLQVLINHTKINLSWGDGGSFNCEKNGEFVYDKKEGEKAEQGIELLKFILQITE